MDDVWAAEIGERIKTARQAAKMSRADVGEALGRTEAAVAAYEQGKRAPFKEIREIARLVNADLAVLLHGESYTDPLTRIEGLLQDILSRLPSIQEQMEQELDKALERDAETSTDKPESSRSPRRQRSAK